MMMILLSIAASCSILGGGLVALRFRDRLHYLLSFTGGVLLGVISFEVIPEIFELSQRHAFDASAALAALVVGFLFFHSLEKFMLIRRSHEAEYAPHYDSKVGILVALAVVGHSLLDGVGIGIAFQVSPVVGASIAFGVIAHNFCDGLNTVGLMLTHGNSKHRSTAMLLLDAVAPVCGAASTLLFELPPYALMLYLGFFAGVLLYIGIREIPPEVHSRTRGATAIRQIGLTGLGSAFVFVLTRSAA